MQHLEADAQPHSGSGVVVSTWLPPAEATAVQALAEADDRSTSALLRRALRAYLNDERRPAEAAAVKEPRRQARHDRD